MSKYDGLCKNINYRIEHNHTAIATIQNILHTYVQISIVTQVNPGQNQVLLSITERFGLLLAEHFDKLPMPVVVSDNISKSLLISPYCVNDPTCIYFM